MLKRTLKIILVVLIALPVLIILPFFAGEVIDNIALSNFKTQFINNLSLPPDTFIVETVSGCGNTGGIGNHTELYVGVLVKTSLSSSEWDKYRFASHKVSDDGMSTRSMRLLGLSFPNIDGTDGFYILEYSKKSPCSDLDIRGH